MTMGFTTIVYGAVSIFRCTTHGISQEPVKDDSGTNLLYQKTTVSISGYLNGRKLQLRPSADPSVLVQTYPLTDVASPVRGPAIPDPMGNASAREQQIRRMLGPRQQFTMLVGDINGDGTSGNPLISCGPCPASMIPGATFAPPVGSTSVPPSPSVGNINLSDLDLHNGPWCTDFKITQVAGDELYSVEATFEICQLECDVNGNVPGNDYGILSNRWTWHDSLDANLRTKRVYAGHLKLASASINANQLRTLVLPPLAQMFRRESIDVDASEDGLTMNWTVTDVEVSMSCPWPARTWDVTHTQGGAAQTQISFMGLNSVEVNLTADVNTNKSDLIELALYIITAKIFGCTPPQLNQPIPGQPLPFWSQAVVKQLEFVDYIGDEIRLSARATVQIVPADLVDQNANPLNFTIGTIAARFGTPIGSADVNTSALQKSGMIVGQSPRPSYDRSFSWGGYANDTIQYASPAANVANIFVNYMQNPCDDNHFTAPGRSTGRRYANLPDIDRNLQIANTGVGAPSQQPTTSNIAVYPVIDPLVIPNPLLSVSQGTAAYTRWQLENIYSTKTMRVQCPIARNPIQYQQGTQGGTPIYLGDNYYPTSSIGFLSGGQCKRILRVSAERVGQEPQFPDPDMLPMFTVPISQGNQLGGFGPAENYAGGIQIFQFCLRKRVRPSTPILTITGQYLYRADAEYLIAMSRPPNPGEQLDLGNDMWSVGRTDLNGNLVTDINNPWYQTTSPQGLLTSADWSKQPADGNVT